MSTLTSNTTAPVSTTASYKGWWLRDPTDPGRDMEIDVTQFEWAQPEESAKFNPVGRKRAVVVSDEIRGVMATLYIEFVEEDKYNNFKELRYTQRVLLLQAPTGDQWYIRFIGEFTMTLENVTTPYRKGHVDFIQVDPA